MTNLHIFRLGYLLSHSNGLEIFYIESFLANVPFLYALKTPGNPKAFGIFRVYKMETMVRNGFIKFILPRYGAA